MDVDRRAMEHWSAMGDFVFCDCFGSGTTLIAALEVGRSFCVGTEPDHSWEAAGQRLDHEIMSYIEFDDQRRKEALCGRGERSSSEGGKSFSKSKVTEGGEEGEEEAESSGRRNGGRSIDGLGVAFRCTF